MKKFFTFFAAVLMAGSMMAMDYTLRVINSQCNAMYVPYVAVYTEDGLVLNQMEINMEKTFELMPPSICYEYTFSAEEGTSYQFLNGVINDQGEVIVVPSFNYESFLQVYEDGAWKRFISEDGLNFYTGEEALIEYDFSDTEKYRWGRCDTEHTLSSITLAADESGIQVTPSDANMMWMARCDQSKFVPDSAEYVIMADNSLETFNETFGTGAWEMVDYYFKYTRQGAQTVTFDPWDMNLGCYIEEGKEYTLSVWGITSTNRGHVDRATNLAQITFTYGVDPTAVENVAAEKKTAKIVENGQMVIIREGKRYNLMGAEL